MEEEVMCWLRSLQDRRSGRPCHTRWFRQSRQGQRCSCRSALLLHQHPSGSPRPSGTVRISRPRRSQAFLNEKWADSGTTDVGIRNLFSAGLCEPECLDIGLGAPADVAYPPASGQWKRVPNRWMRSFSSDAVPGKSPGSPRLVSMNMQCALHRNRVGEGAHGAQDVVVVQILCFFLGEKREEFFFGTTLIQHRGFSQPRG